jgi:hypothetical protein
MKAPQHASRRVLEPWQRCHDHVLEPRIVTRLLPRLQGVGDVMRHGVRRRHSIASHQGTPFVLGSMTNPVARLVIALQSA